MVNIRSAYCDKEHKGIAFKKPSFTQQHHKKDCDVNNIIKKYDKTGLITHVNHMKAQFGDFSEVMDYQEAQNVLIGVQEHFMQLPSYVRKQFDNDPETFMNFVSNPDNADEMIKYGLATKITPAEGVEPATASAPPIAGDAGTGEA